VLAFPRPSCFDGKSQNTFILEKKKGRTNELNGWKLATGQAALFIATSIGPHPSKCSIGLQGLFFFEPESLFSSFPCTVQIPWSPGFESGMASQGLWLHALTTPCEEKTRPAFSFMLSDWEMVYNNNNAYYM